MKLTPLDIRKQEFKRVMRGYDADEVDAFLTMIADDLEFHIRERNRLNDELIQLRTQLGDYQRVESTLRDTLVKAQNTVEDTRANSRREAEIIIHEAELQAEDIIKESREELLGLRHEIALLNSQKEAIMKRLRHMLESQLEMLDIMRIEEKPKTEQRLVRPEPKAPQPMQAPASRPRMQREEQPRIVRPGAPSQQQPRPSESREKPLNNEMRFNIRPNNENKKS